MGYRAYIGKIPKKARSQFAGMTEEQVYGLIESCTPAEHTELYEVGKNFHYLKEELSPFFDFTSEDTDFQILSRKGLKEYIELERKFISETYTDLLKDILNGGKEGIEVELRRKSREWSDNTVLPYWLDEEETDGFVVRSWLREYAIFNLVHIYRSFDWENDYLIFSAH